MTIIIGTRTEQIILNNVLYIMTDTCELRLHTDGKQAVIEEVTDDEIQME